MSRRNKESTANYFAGLQAKRQLFVQMPNVQHEILEGQMADGSGRRGVLRPLRRYILQIVRKEA